MEGDDDDDCLTLILCSMEGDDDDDCFNSFVAWRAMTMTIVLFLILCSMEGDDDDDDDERPLPSHSGHPMPGHHHKVPYTPFWHSFIC
jgi:hypothetical protein